MSNQKIPSLTYTHLKMTKMLVKIKMKVMTKSAMVTHQWVVICKSRRCYLLGKQPSLLMWTISATTMKVVALMLAKVTRMDFALLPFPLHPLPPSAFIKSMS